MEARIEFASWTDETGSYIRAQLSVHPLEPLAGAWMRSEEGALKELAYTLQQKDNVKYLAALVGVRVTLHDLVQEYREASQYLLPHPGVLLEELLDRLEPLGSTSMSRSTNREWLPKKTLRDFIERYRVASKGLLPNPGDSTTTTAHLLKEVLAVLEEMVK